MTGPAAVLTLLGKPDCHLCHRMREVVDMVLADYRASCVERDVRADPRHRPFLLEIPVLLLDEQELARHRVTGPELRRLLDERGVSRR